MKKILFAFTFLFTFFLLGCSLTTSPNSGSNSNGKDSSNPTKSATITKEYWGVWIQMDTGDEFYIDGNSIYKSSSSNKKYSKIQDGISGYTLENAYILKQNNIRYFKKGGISRDFSIQIAGFSDSYSRSARAASTGQQGINGRRENGNNPSDKETATSDEDGKTDFTDAVADDPQTITIDDGTSVVVTPEYDGQDMGTIPIVENGMYGFKTTYTIDSDAQGFCYGNLYKTYTLRLNLNNIGSITCATSTYNITCEDPKLQFVSGELAGNFSSIEPKKSKSLTFSINYGSLDEEYVDVPIKISISDSKYQRTWNDSITLRFHKGLVALKVNSRNFDSNSSAKLNGFFIYPDGRSKRFTVQSGNVSTITIPWSTKDYIIAFSGATASNEMAYSFCFTKTATLADLSGMWTIQDILAYENNDTVAEGKRITDLSNSVKAYLSDGDIDFYIINNSSISLGYEPITYHAKSYTDSNSTTNTYNNMDGKINPGETITMDIRLQNIVDALVEDINLTLSSESNYISFLEPTKSYGSMKGGYYKTQYGTQYYANNEDYKYGYTSTYSYGSYNYPYSGTLNNTYGWTFTIDKDTPYNTIIPIKLTFSDKTGKQWFESFDLEVLKPGIEIVYHANSYSDSLNTTNPYNNKDGKINPGETISMDIRIHNKGSSRAIDVMSKLTTTSPYITLTSNEKSYGSISGNYYKTQYGSQNYANNEDYKYGYSSNYSYGSYNYPYSGTLNPSYGWTFTVAEDTPYNTVIPFSMEFTDKNGDTWTDSFSLTVVKPSIEIVYHANEINDPLSTSNPYNNKDGKINPGETISMDIRIHNMGSSRAIDVMSKLTTTSPYITLTSNEKSYGSISGNYYKTQYGSQNYANNEDYKYGYSSNYSYGSYNYPYSGTLNPSYGWTFTVAEDTPYNTVIPFSMEFTDKNGDTWTDSFSLTVVKPSIEIVYHANEISDSVSNTYTINNGDGKINPGETIAMDVRIQNNGTSKAMRVMSNLTTTSQYVSLTSNEKSYETINPGYYKTQYGTQYYANDDSYKYGYTSSTSYGTTTYPYSGTLKPSWGWTFVVDKNTPYNTIIPFEIEFTDIHGDKWTDSFDLTVQKADVSISVVGKAWNDAKSINANNNEDTGFNPGETINLDLRIKNTGTAAALGLIAKLTSDSSYITFTDNICDYGKLSGGYYKTSYTSSNSTGYNTETSASYSTLNNPGYIFKISDSTPANTQIPITITITDNQLNTWTDIYTIIVVEPSIELKYISYALSDKITSGYLNDGDGKIEPGEKIFLDFCIQNSGTSQSKTNTISFESSVSYISFNTNSRSYGTINPGKYQSYTKYSSSSSTYGWTQDAITMTPESYSACIFTVDSNASVNSEIPIKIKMADGNKVVWEYDLVLNIE